MSKTNKHVPRGIRNNNPLNIERTRKTLWTGLASVQTDRRFCQFISMDWGLRAAFKVLDTYYWKHHLMTLAHIIGRWAPESENQTTLYIRTVAQRSGIDPDEVLLPPADDPTRWQRIVGAMAFVECGVELSKQQLERGYQLYQLTH